MSAALLGVVALSPFLAIFFVVSAQLKRRVDPSVPQLPATAAFVPNAVLVLGYTTALVLLVTAGRLAMRRRVVDAIPMLFIAVAIIPLAYLFAGMVG